MKRRVRSPVTAGCRQMRTAKNAGQYPNETKSVKEYMLCTDYSRGLSGCQAKKQQFSLAPQAARLTARLNCDSGKERPRRPS